MLISLYVHWFYIMAKNYLLMKLINYEDVGNTMPLIGVTCLSSNLTRISPSSLVSMLINRKAIKEVGLPVKEFFIWFDDAEYSRRISEKMSCYLVADSIVIHETPTNTSSLDFAQLNSNSIWKFSYGIRNQASYHFEKEGFAAGAFFCLRIISRMWKNVHGWPLRSAILKACWQGWRFKYLNLIERIK